MLKVTRRQLPLAPAFAITAHAAQGQTLKKAIVDLQIGRGTSPIAAYVALTRVASLQDLLIYRDFPLDLYTQGPPEGPELLLKTLRGEYVDWAAVEEKHTPSHSCTGCGFVRFKDEFALSQWNRKDGRRFCSECIQVKVKSVTPLECLSGCGLWKPLLAFSDDNAKKRVHRICKDCAQQERRICQSCQRQKTASEFHSNEWRYAGFPGQRGHCNDCNQSKGKLQCTGTCGQRKDKAEFSKWSSQHKKSGSKQLCNRCYDGVMDKAQDKWTCQRCKKQQNVSHFTTWLQTNKSKKPNGRQRCNGCRAEEEEAKRIMANDTWKSVMQFKAQSSRPL